MLGRNPRVVQGMAAERPDAPSIAPVQERPAAVTLDHEVSAIAVIFDALGKLDEPACRRVLGIAWQRFVDGGK